MVLLLWFIAAMLVLVGLAGTLLPILPGVPLVFGGLLLGAWIDGFVHVGWPLLLVLALLTLLSVVVDVAATSLGAKGAGAGRAAMLGAASERWWACSSARSGCWLDHSWALPPGSSWSGKIWSRQDAPASERGSGFCWAAWPSSHWAWPWC